MAFPLENGAKRTARPGSMLSPRPGRNRYPPIHRSSHHRRQHLGPHKRRGDNFLSPTSSGPARAPRILNTQHPVPPCGAEPAVTNRNERRRRRQRKNDWVLSRVIPTLHCSRMNRPLPPNAHVSPFPILMPSPIRRPALWRALMMIIVINTLLLLNVLCHILTRMTGGR